jgi:2-polyprenyl-3-methyl-5-hydroxy-6-metoxy-1,4-benzoquinol methylase
MSQPWYHQLETAAVTLPAASYGALIDRTCPLCGAASARTILPRQYYALASLDVMAVVECRACRFLFTNPVPTPAWFERYLDRRSNPWWGDDAGWMTRHWQEENQREKFEDGLRLIRQLQDGGALVDVGCGPGLFVRMARDAGFDAIGVDVFGKVIDPADGTLSCIPVAALPPASVDVLTLWCVVAHEQQFLRLLRDCHTALRPGGLIFIETPNMTLWRWLRPLRGTLEHVMSGARTHDVLGAYAHINHFTVATLRKALDLSRFRDVRFHLIRNYPGARSWLDGGKRLLFALSGARVNLCFPLVATAYKRS